MKRAIVFHLLNCMCFDSAQHDRHTERSRSIANIFLKNYIIMFSVALYLILSVFRFAGAGRDDTFLTLWAGEQLAKGDLWMNYNLESSEMSSSLLHTIIIAVIRLLFPNHVYFVNKVFGLVTGGLILLTISVYYPLFMKDRQAGQHSWFFLTLLSLAAYPAWMYWNLGGLETPLQSWLLLLYVIAFVNLLEQPAPHAYPLAILQCLYLFVRPEGFLMIPLTWVCLISYHWYHKKKWSLFCPWFKSVIVPPLVCFLVLTAIRYFLLGTLFPNPVYAKVGARQVVSSNLVTGFQYLYGFYKSSPLTILQFLSLLIAAGFIMISFLKRAELNIPLALSSAVVALNHAFVVLVGGNWMEFFRFVAPISPLLVLITIMILQQFTRRFPVLQRRFAHIAIILGLTGLGIIHFLYQKDRAVPKNDGNCALPLNLREISQTWSWETLNDDLMQLNCAQKRDWSAIVPFIRDDLPDIAARLGSELRIVTYQMGFFPYYVKHTHPDLDITFIDTAGLIDIHVARLPLPKDSGGIIGYSRLSSILTGEAGVLSDYVLQQHPNMCYAMGIAEKNRQKLLQNGWSLIWNKPMGVVFIKEAS